MNQDYWHKQTAKPLFPQLNWTRPENKAYAGKLLIIGGTAQGFSAPAEAYNQATQAGIGTARVLLPTSLQKTISKLFPEAEFAPSTPSGSFGTSALAEFIDASEWANSVLLAGSSGKNSETTVLFENFLEKYNGQATITKDAADHFSLSPFTILQRPNTLLVLTLTQLQRLGSSARFARAFTTSMGLVQLVAALHEFTKRFTPYIIVRYENTLVVAVAGQISTTTYEPQSPTWCVRIAATASVWWLQNSNKPFEAITTAVL